MGPAYGPLEDALREGEWAAASTAFGEVAKTCNHRHQAIDHGYIRIDRRADNPYTQSFAPPE